jgi:hypothetical protein
MGNSKGFILGAVVAVLAGGAWPYAASAQSTACAHQEFKTELVKQACAKGGQKEAKDAMKAFSKDHAIKSCNQCHSKLAPSYDLKPDGLDQYRKLGGK